MAYGQGSEPRSVRPPVSQNRTLVKCRGPNRAPPPLRPKTRDLFGARDLAPGSLPELGHQRG
jgi:hypothetical protein